MRKLKARVWCRWQYWVTKYPLLKRWRRRYKQVVLAERPVRYYPLDEVLNQSVEPNEFDETNPA
jgi:hypothetical protein